MNSDLVLIKNLALNWLKYKVLRLISWNHKKRRYQVFKEISKLTGIPMNTLDGMVGEHVDRSLMTNVPEDHIVFHCSMFVVKFKK